MELRKRRNELFSAEMSLRRAMLHLLSDASWALRMQDALEQKSQDEAWQILFACYRKVTAEQKEII
jgi:hypothetical protein